MKLVVKCLLFLNVFISDIQEIATTFADPVDLKKYRTCFLEKSYIGPTFKRAGSCKDLSLIYVNFTESSPELFANLTEGLDSLNVFGSIVDTIYLPVNLISFYLAATPGRSTEIIIDGNSVYKLEQISVENLSKLPVHVDKLSSLKIFECRQIHGTNIDFSIFATMMQLEQINLYDTESVTIPQSLQLPSLRQLTIQNSLMTSFNMSSYELPKLEVLRLENSSLFEIPAHLNTFKNLVQFSMKGNKLRHVILDVFGNMSQLELFVLTDNQIAEITTKNTVDLPRLKELDIDGNNLANLNVTLWSMPALEHLCLSFNKLKQVPDLLNLLTTKVHTLLMYSNPWDCVWLNITVLQISGMQVRTALDGSCYAYGRSTNQFGPTIWRQQ